MKPIIFLNIDGVLISEDYIMNNTSNTSKLYTKYDNTYYMNFEDNKIELLKSIVNELDAYIVIVSYWCYLNDLNKFKLLFKKYNLDDRIIDTISYSTKEVSHRIHNWLLSYINCKNFAIIDDDDILLYKDKHVKCNPKVGLINNDINKLKKILKK